jgi:chemotaxis signal transduction protein
MTSIDDLVPHMRHVQAAEREMRELSLVWQTIESAAAISCPEEVASILPTLTRTRERFGALQQRLIASLATESRAELGDELTAKARCAIDILVRNLFERTADVGFLATDDVIRAFCLADDDGRDATRDAMRGRLAAYQAKYSVYEDVVVLAPDGSVLVRLDESSAIARSNDPIVADALQGDGYRERFGTTDLAAEGVPALLYAHRIHDGGRTVGVLVLVFRFFDEMRRIFSGMVDERAQIALMLIDDRERVIASNDEAHVPRGAVLARVAPDDVVLTTFAGREYLAVCCATRGYQGYRGPAWRAQAMVSLLTAFRPRAEDGEGTNVPLDNEGLAEIQRDADEINRELRRVVWNGRLMARTGQGDQIRLKAVLNQVNLAGARTRERVALAIRDLYRTSLARARHQAGDLARLAADIMDRNLYERANDCRWWALSPAIAEQLRAPPSESSRRALDRTLDALNDLYTVYGRLVAFDAAGRVRGLSRAASAPPTAGASVDPEWLESIRRLDDPQRYAVTPFESNAFHDAGDTYVYLAAIRDPGHGALLGGIAIVFNASVEFGAMVRDVIGERQGFAALVDPAGRVVSTTNAELATGSLLKFQDEVALVEHEGANYACARVRTTGYREFKTGDGYDNGVQAVVALRLGRTDRRRRTLSDEALQVQPPTLRDAVQELGVFQVGPGRYAIAADQVIRAVTNRGIVRAPSVMSLSAGLLEVELDEGPQLVHVLCARRLFGVDYPARASDGVVLVLRSGAQPGAAAFGLRVDDVLAVLEVRRQQVHDAPVSARGARGFVRGIVDCALEVPAGSPQRKALVQVVDAQALVDAAVGSARGGVTALPDRSGALA